MYAALIRSSLLTVGILLAPNALGQTDWFVDAAGAGPGTGTAQDPYTSIQFALAQPATVSGDRLLVASGTYAESIDYLGKNVTVAHDGAGALPRIEGQNQVSAVSFVSGETNGARLEGFVVTGSVPLFPTPEPGGGLLVNGAAPVLVNVTVRDCSAGLGGGIAVLAGDLTLLDCQILSNTSIAGGGGVHLAQGSLQIEGGLIADNLVDGPFDHGGGIEALAGTVLTLQDTIVELNNVSSGRGGGISAEGAATLENVEIRQNEKGDFFNICYAGAGIYAPMAVGTNCKILNNGHLATFDGGGASGGTWIDSEIRGNVASQHGAGLDGGIAQNCDISDNRNIGEGDVPSGPGGGAARSTLIDCLIANNQSEGHGGGTADCVLERCVVRGNRTVFFDWGDGAGVYQGTAVDCLIEGNVTGGSFGIRGGGAHSADLERCVIRGNISQEGGGVYGGTMDRCTVVHNLAIGNFGSFGGGVADVDATNSIVWGNSPNQFEAGTLTYSNVQGGAPGTDNISADPLFFGPGSDVHLLPNSPCVDAGDPAAVPDADGSRADMGAFAFELLHRREDGAFCFGELDLTVSSEVSITGPPAVLGGFGVQAFALATNAGYAPRVFPSSAFGGEPSGLCLTGGITRVFPTSGSELELSPAVLSQLGLVPGDRLIVQAYRLQFGGIDFSQGLDLLVRP